MYLSTMSFLNDSLVRTGTSMTVVSPVGLPSVLVEPLAFSSAPRADVVAVARPPVEEVADAGVKG